MLSKDAFDSVCEMVANNYTTKGWKYAKSKHWMTKKDKKFTYKVYFYTSWNNISDVSVTFYGAAAIIPAKSKDPIYDITTQDYNIPKGKLDWNIAEEKDWDYTCSEFIEWLEKNFICLVKKCTENLDQFVRDVVKEGFCPERGYITDILFILNNGTRELAEESAQYYYNNLDEGEKLNFKNNYKSLMDGKGSFNAYGKNYMLNYCNFKTIIENKIKINL